MWWEHRISAQRGEGANFWRRWRLVDEMLQRYYGDQGIQPIFGWMGSELYQVAVASPCCVRAPRYFGRLCDQGGLHPESNDVDMINDHLGGLTLAPYGPTGDVTDRSWHPETEELTGTPWFDYLEHSIHVLGLDGAGVAGHEGCFHRRGRDLTPLMFRIALLLRTGDEGHGISGDDFVRHVPTTNDAGDLQEAVDILRIHGQENHPGAPRSMAVRHQGIWYVIRNDGVIFGGGDTVDAAAHWRSGATADRIATYARDACP